MSRSTVGPVVSHGTRGRLARPLRLLRPAAVVLAAASAFRAEAAFVSIELKPAPGQTMVGRGFYLEARVRNTGSTNVTGVSYALVIESLGGLATKVTTSAGIVNPLNAGGDSSVMYSFLATRAGNLRFTFTLAGTEAGSPVRVSSEPLVVEIGDESANRPAQGTFQIRHNILRVRKDDWYPPHEMAYLVVTGPPGGVVSFAVHGPSGRRIGGVAHQIPATSGPGIEFSEWTIGADGRLTVPFDGVIGQQLLGSGSYWMVVTGAVSGKQPFVVVKQ